jgi:hypothetical protein
MPFRASNSGGRGLYNPVFDPDLALIELWSARAGLTLAGGLVSSMLGQKNGYTATAAGGLRPTYSATGITDSLGVSYPAIVFAGAQGLQSAAISAALSGLAQITVMLGIQVSQVDPTAIAMVMELGGPFSLGDGRFLIAVNDTNASSMECGMHYAGTGYWRTQAGECPLADPGVLQCGLGGGANGTTLRTLDGVNLLGADVANSMVSPAVIANETLYIGSRTNSSLFFSGAISDILILGAAATTAAKLRARLWMGERIGALQA